MPFKKIMKKYFYLRGKLKIKNLIQQKNIFGLNKKI